MQAKSDYFSLVLVWNGEFIEMVTVQSNLSHSAQWGS